MKRISYILVLFLISCTTTEKLSMLPEDELYITRKYVGNFLDYQHTLPEFLGDPHIIWIKTAQDTLYRKISAYSQKCEFNPGDRLYLRRTYYTPTGVFGYWVYQIENDSDLFYRIREFQDDSRILVQTWF